jgi:hypothetical protein
MNIPEFNTKFICIVDRGKVELAAVISSYLHQNNKFLSVFEFPTATTGKTDNFSKTINEHSMSIVNSEALSIQIHNAINKIGGCDYLIIGGLSEYQKSFLTFLHDFNYIEINSTVEVESCLGGLALEKEKYLLVQPKHVLKGLFLAGRNGLKLHIDITADTLNVDSNQNSGLVIVENNETTSSIAAINYALSINSDIQIITPYCDSEIQKIKNLIEDWQEGNDSSFRDLSGMILSRVEEIDFSQYKFATFFTEGSPYSLILENKIPFSYVHLNRYPNLFIIDNIYFEKRNTIGSSIVFSPLEFGTDEETEFAIKVFEDNFYWVKKLIGKEASAHNIDLHVKEYPYDIIHICSHGGEVSGYSVTKEFYDQDGNKHTVEYDDVISFHPEKGEELITVETKHIWRKFDGFLWRSKELEEQNYPHYVFSDMLNVIIADGKPGKIYDGVPKSIVPHSCSIKCSDFIYQAMFNMVACFHTSPIIFNNTCWSWSGIADSFLSGGVRGYIGTLWAINNNVAKSVAENFYQNLFDDTILNSLYKAIAKSKGTKSQNIYIYWGLHFSTLKKAKSVKDSRMNIAEYLLGGFYQWRHKSMTTAVEEIKINSKKLAEWDIKQLYDNFSIEADEIIKERKFAASKGLS